MKKTTLLIDITGVLFWESKVRFARVIGLGTLLRYIVTHRAHPVHRVLQLLHFVSTPQPSPLTQLHYKNRRLPSCISAWQQGLITSQELQHELTALAAYAHKHRFFTSEFEYRLLSRILITLVDAQTLLTIAKPNKRLIRLIRKIKARGNHKLIIVSNLAHETFELLAEYYPDLLALFENVVISAQVGLVKPNTQLYTHVLQQYNLDAQSCIFIDDQADNIAAAQGIGISGIVYNRFSSVKRQLRLFGVI